MATKKLPTVAEDRHAAGLQMIAGLLSHPDAHHVINRAREAGEIDNALAHTAMAAVDLQESTTATLRLSRAAAIMVLRHLIEPLVDEWGNLDPSDRNIDETNLNFLSDRAQSISDYAEALAYDACAWPYTQETLRGQEREAARRRRARAQGNEHAIQRVAPETLARLEALRSEFETDPDGYDLLVSLATACVLPESTAPAPE